jgi:hypothetical protein
VTAASQLTDSDRSTQSALISDQSAGLTSLKAKIDADTEPAQLREDCEQIVLGFRVYLRTSPKVHLVMAADRELSVADRLTDMAGKLQAKADDRKAAGNDTAAAQSAIDDLVAKVNAARDLAQPVPGTVEALTPAQYNAGTAGPVLDASRSALESGRDDLQAAIADAKTARAALKG